MEAVFLFAAFMFLPFNVSLLVAASYLYYKYRQKEMKGYNPFTIDERKPRRPYILDQKERDTIIKQSFSKDKIAENIDVIVIGSGIGSLSLASILTKAGKKVLVLEQHDQAGGCCHTFIDKGYEFDVGIHYIGKMEPFTSDRFLLDQISEGQIEWAELDEAFDIVSIGYGEENRKYPIYKGQEVWRKRLEEQFPKEKDGISSYFELMDSYNGYGFVAGMLKMLPLLAARVLVKSALVHFFTNVWSGRFRKSTQEVLTKITSDKDLQTVLSYSWGDYGTMPSESQALTQVSLSKYFAKEGAYYPVGGASEIALNIIPVVERNGGRVLVRANVTEIIVEGGRACGVRVAKGSETHEIRAPVIVSGAGIYNTFQKLLPKEIAQKSYFSRFAKDMKPGLAAMNIFIGLSTTAEELELEKNNTWAFTSNEFDAFQRYLELDVDQAMVTDVPLMFFSFPSHKDPHWKNHPGRESKTTCTIVTLTNWKWFKEFEKTKLKKRGDRYEEIKNAIGHRLIEQICSLKPKLKRHIDYVEIGSPVTNLHYLNQPHGEIYGLDHTLERFDPWMMAQLRPETDVKGLFLTGQDVMSAGFAGALFGGLFAGSAILGRNLGGDLEILAKAIQKKKNE